MLSLEQEQTQGKKCFIALLGHVPGALRESLLATFQHVGPCYLAGLENFSRKVPVRKKNTIRAFVNTEIYLKNVSITAKFSSGKGWNKSALQPGFKRFLWAFVLWNLNLIVI